MRKSEYKSLKKRIVRSETIIGWLLIIYLILIGIGSVAIIIANFPLLEESKIVFPNLVDNKPKFIPFGTVGSTASGLLLLAFFSGVAGSFLHAAQSLGTYSVFDIHLGQDGNGK